jgi:hypothetical protein
MGPKTPVAGAKGARLSHASMAVPERCAGKCGEALKSPRSQSFRAAAAFK